MPLTFRKSFRILPGVRLNINKRSWSVTTGGENGTPRSSLSARASTRASQNAMWPKTPATVQCGFTWMRSSFSSKRSIRARRRSRSRVFSST